MLISTTALTQAINEIDTAEIDETYYLENIIESTLEENENSTIDDEIKIYEENKLDLDVATIDELSNLPFINPKIARNIIKTRKRTKFKNIEDLLLVEDMTIQQYSLIQKFVIINNEEENKEIKASLLSRIKTDIEKRKGYLNGSYAGSPLKTFSRFRLSYRNNDNSSIITEMITGGLVEKDPGEKDLNNFSSGFLSVKSLPLKMRVILGDYQIRTGEGLVFGGINRNSKVGTLFTNSSRNKTGLQPFMTADENNYFRGAAISLNSDYMNIQLLYSDRSINASIDSNGFVRSIDNSGLFRTKAEIKKKNSANEKMVGCNLQMDIINNLKIGCTGYKTIFRNPYLFKSVSNQSTSAFQVWGFNVMYDKKDYDVFTEVAIDNTNKIAKNGGLIYSPQKNTTIVAIIRDYPNGFFSLYSNAFGERWDNISDEKGFFFGIRTRAHKKMWLSFYYDQYCLPSSYQNNLIRINGNELLLSTEYKILKNYDFDVRYKQKNSLKTFEDFDIYGRGIKYLVQQTQRNYRLTGKLKYENIQLNNKIEWVNIIINSDRKEKGLLLAQSMKWRLNKSMKIFCRVTFFNTESYRTRIYDFEDDIPGVYTNSALFGKGLRWYLMLRYQVYSKIFISSKYSQTIKDGVNSIGTANDEIMGDKQSTISLQIEVKL